MISLKTDVTGGNIVVFGKNNEVKVNFALEGKIENEMNLLNRILKSPLFVDYLSLFTKPNSLKLTSITFKEVKIAKDEIELLKISVDTEDKFGNSMKGYDVNLVGCSSYLLILLRINDTVKDLCVLMSLSRPNIGKQDVLELPGGTFDENEKFVGEAADLIFEYLNISVRRNNVISLTDLAFNEGSSFFTNKNSDQRFSIYLHRLTVSHEKVVELESKICKQNVNSESNQLLNNAVLENSMNDLSLYDAGCNLSYKKLGVQIRLVPLGDAWKSTIDCKATSAIFLVHELRYHRLMPKYNSTDNTYGLKKSAKFTKIGVLEPESAGVNIKVKIVKPIKLMPDKMRRDGTIQREGILVVGDSEGTIMLKLTQDQLNIKDDVGTPMIIRNAKVEMNNGHMILCVNRWGKIETNVDGDEDFDFIVQEGNDMSSTEFELVVLDNMPDNNVEHMDRSTTPGSRQGRRAFGGPPRYGSGRRFGPGSMSAGNLSSRRDFYRR